MRVALAHDHLFQIGGAELVLKKLADIYPQAPIYTLICNEHARNYLRDKNIITSYLQKIPGGKSLFKLFLRWMPTAWEYFDFTNYDLVISSASAFAKNIITTPPTMHISYCHSPTRYLWSDRTEYIGSLRIPTIIKLYLQNILTDLRLVDLEAARRVDYFIANSKFIADRIRHFYKRDSTVIYPPVQTSAFQAHKQRNDYYLVVSRLRPYKRVDLVIEAFNHLRLPLVVIGGGEELPRLKAMARPHIKLLGEVPWSTRNKYLSRCKAFIHPQEEDFGISAVEAMASGSPVIAYQAGGALETVQEYTTGLFFPEQSWESLAYAVIKSRTIDFSSAAIQEYAKTFDESVFQTSLTSFVNSVRPQ